MEYLDKWEIERANMCIANIKDKMQSVDFEVLGRKPYKLYLLEKLNSVLHDVNCLINMCEKR